MRNTLAGGFTFRRGLRTEQDFGFWVLKLEHRALRFWSVCVNSTWRVVKMKRVSGCLFGGAYT